MTEKQKPVPSNCFQKMLQLIFNTRRQSLISQISKTDGQITKYASITEKHGAATVTLILLSL